jgi:hypothetical protein
METPAFVVVLEVELGDEDDTVPPVVGPWVVAATEGVPVVSTPVVVRLTAPKVGLDGQPSFDNCESQMNRYSVALNTSVSGL